MSAVLADDLFAGSGGWDLAAEALGITARGVELMPEARATRDAAGLETIHDDVWTFRPDGNAAGGIASPPCQTFSTAGRGAGRKALDDVLRGVRDRYYRDLDHLRFLGLEVGDERTALVLTPLHFALTAGYEWLAWEQVPAVLPVWEACAEVLRGSKWHTWTGILSAEAHGAPQTRRRAVLLASRRGPVTAPAPTRSRYYPHDPAKLDAGVPRWASMADVLDLPPDVVLRASNNARAAIRRAAEPAPTMLFGHCMNDVRWYPAGTTTRGVAETAAGRHPESRRVTVEEASLLQTFPADYPWRGSTSKRYLQIGNAVPPRLALAALAEASGLPLPLPLSPSLAA